MKMARSLRENETKREMGIVKIISDDPEIKVIGEKDQKRKPHAGEI